MLGYLEVSWYSPLAYLVIYYPLPPNFLTCHDARNESILLDVSCIVRPYIDSSILPSSQRCTIDMSTNYVASSVM